MHAYLKKYFFIVRLFNTENFFCLLKILFKQNLINLQEIVFNEKYIFIFNKYSFFIVYFYANF